MRMPATSLQAFCYREQSSRRFGPGVGSESRKDWKISKEYRISDCVLQLRDGRQLAYTRWNERGRYPILFCPGTPGSRLFRPADPVVLLATDVDFVTVDRPGYGRSTPQDGRTLLDWPNDVAELARELRWERFSIAGISGRAPHALACDCRLMDHVTAVGVVSGVAPFWADALEGMLPTTRTGFQLAHRAPWLLKLAACWAKITRDRFLDRLRSELPECDRAILDRPDVTALSAENASVALSTIEMAREMILLRNPWGFELSDVQVPVKLWHGGRDRNVPIAHGRRSRARFPTVTRPLFLMRGTTSSLIGGGPFWLNSLHARPAPRQSVRFDIASGVWSSPSAGLRRYRWEARVGSAALDRQGCR